jgi:hypothetical protein
MNAMQFETDVEQDAVKMKSFLDVGVNKLSGSDNSVNNKIENPQPNSEPKSCVINSNIRGLGRGCLLPYMKLNKLSGSDNSVTPLHMTSNAFFKSPNNVSNMVENRYSGSQLKMNIRESFVNSEATANLNFFSSQTGSLTSLSAPAHENGAPQNQSSYSLNKNQTRKSSSSSTTSTTSISSSSSSHLESAEKDIVAFSINSPKSPNLFNKVTFLLLFFLLLRYLGLG